MIIGSKENFAIEYELNDDKVGLIRLWVNRYPIGLWEETYVLPVAITLERVRDFSSEEALNINLYPAKEIYNSIMQNEDMFSGTLLGFGESFDCFEIRMYLYVEVIVFIWKIINTKNDNLIAEHYEPNTIYSAIVNQKYYSEILSRFKLHALKAD